jgi:RimJ/RimL family protein N-acetyltransferase
MVNRVRLRQVAESDLPIFFENQLDPEANWMAAFTAKNPADREAFMAHWAKIMADESILIKTVLWRDDAETNLHEARKQPGGWRVAGSVLSYMLDGKPEVSYWMGKEFWGKGIATRALAEFLMIQKSRPIFAHVARDNLASIRVLVKCGFEVCGEGKWFANARGEEIGEYVLILR